MPEKEKQRKELISHLNYYLENYNELTKTRPKYKKVVDKEIKELIKLIKALSR